MTTKQQALSERFWSKVNKNGPIPSHQKHLGRCWVWDGCVSGGRAYFCFNGRSTNSSRVAWMIHSGKPAGSLWVLHKCDNQLCVNPHHLFTGTALDNNRDMMEKGRYVNPHKLKTTCKFGHRLYTYKNGKSGENKWRYCRKCACIREARYRKIRNEAAVDKAIRGEG